jgi:hypothetical protein
MEKNIIIESSEINEESLISKEVREIKRKLVVQSKTAVEILLDDNISYNLRTCQEVKITEKAIEKIHSIRKQKKS